MNPSDLSALADHQKAVADKQSTRDPEISRLTEYYESEGTQLAIDVYLPNAEKYPGIRPGILFFFGGGFRVGTRKVFQMQAEECANQGYVAFSADYRIFALHGSTPWDSIRDGAAAWLYIRKHASRWQLDPEHVVLSGGSAGGLIALMCGRVSGIQPAGLVLFNPAIPDGNNENDLIQKMVGIDSKGISLVDSLHPDSDICPTLILHGEADQTVPITGIRQFCASAAVLGRDVTLVAYPGVGHGFFHHFRNRAHYHLTVGQMLLFLEKINGIETAADFLSSV